MARFTTGVFVKAPTLNDALAQVADLMKPYRKENFYDDVGKWVSYTIGGYSCNGIPLKDGSKAAHAKVQDVQFDGDPRVYTMGLENWDNLMISVTKYGLFRKKTLLENYSSKEEYAKNVARFITHTFLTPTGEWFETGRMNIVSIVSDKERTVQKTYQQQWDKAIVDFDDCYFILLDCQNREPLIH